MFFKLKHLNYYWSGFRFEVPNIAGYYVCHSERDMLSLSFDRQSACKAVRGRA